MRKKTEITIKDILSGLDKSDCITVLRMTYERMEKLERTELAKMAGFSKN